MWNSSIKAEYLASTIVQAIEAYSIRGTETVLVDSINELRKQFPNCTDAEMGFLVRSADKAKQIEELLKELVRMHVYKKIS